MKFEACISCLRVVSFPTYMARDKNPHIVYRIIENKLYYSFDKERWFPFTGTFHIDDILAEDWNLFHIFKKSLDNKTDSVI